MGLEESSEDIYDGSQFVRNQGGEACFIENGNRNRPYIQA